MTILKTDRLVLRPFASSDLEPLHQIFSDPRAMRYWDRPAYDTVAETQKTLDAFMSDAPARHLEYAIEMEGAMIGRVGMWQRFEVGYILHPDHWGRGIVTEAMAALMTELEHRFPEAPAFTAEIDPRNSGSARVLEKLGFAHTHTEEKNFLYGADEWCDTGYYSRANRAQA